MLSAQLVPIISSPPEDSLQNNFPHKNQTRLKKITILAAAYNEEDNLKRFHSDLASLIAGTPVDCPHDYAKHNQQILSAFKPELFEWEFLFVNDGSSDHTLDVLRSLRAADPRVHFVNLSRNFGKENALLAGMDFASGDAVIIMDADLQDPVYLIPEMIYWWEQGFDDIYGKRSNRGKESWLRRRLSLTFYKILQNSTKIDVLPNVGDFRLLDRRAVDAIRNLRENQRYTKGLYCWVGFKKKEIVFDRADRSKGKSSFKFSSLFNLAIEGITSYTTAPLRFSSILGFVVSLYAIIHIIFVLIKTLAYGEPVQGFPTLLCAILFIGGVQLIAIGIIGEYIGRIFNETKRRPPYIAESFDDETPKRQ